MAHGDSKQLFITLVGGGNSTHCLAPLAAAQGHKVAILTRRPAYWNDTVGVRHNTTRGFAFRSRHFENEIISIMMDL